MTPCGSTTSASMKHTSLSSAVRLPFSAFNSIRAGRPAVRSTWRTVVLPLWPTTVRVPSSYATVVPDEGRVAQARAGQGLLIELVGDRIDRNGVVKVLPDTVGRWGLSPPQTFAIEKQFYRVAIAVDTHTAPVSGLAGPSPVPHDVH